jgi:N-acetylmuramic acid 6-phosphate etherase
MDELPLTETVSPSTIDLDRLNTRELLQRINDEDRRAAWAVERQLGTITAAVDAIVERLHGGGSLHYFGAGTSGRLGVLDAAEIPPTFSSVPTLVRGHIAGGAAALTRAVEDAEDDADAGASEVAAARIGAADAVVGISASGSAAYVLGAAAASRAAGALVIGITNSPGSPLEVAVDLPIVLLTGPEALAGSTRMKAATAQKMTLTMMSTAVMIKLGKVYGNLMVDVTATNKKLRARALRLTTQVTGAPEDVARAALERSGFRVKVAAVMIARGCDPAGAEALLLQNGGSLRAALGKR